MLFFHRRTNKKYRDRWLVYPTSQVMDDLRGAAGGEGWDGPGEYDDAPAAPMPRLRGISVGEVSRFVW